MNKAGGYMDLARERGIHWGAAPLGFGGIAECAFLAGLILLPANLAGGYVGGPSRRS
ncbi:MAG: hypothetical protein AB1425_17200 [Actinomycetota bacterium]